MDRLQRSSLNLISTAAGYIIPMAVNFISTPLLLSALGEAGYGLQNLVGVITGYLAIMDFGLDIAIIKFLAADQAAGKKEGVKKLLSTTIQIYIVMGLIGMTIIMLASDLLSTIVFKVPADLREPARMVFILAGVGFLANFINSWGRATCYGLQRYDLSNTLTILTTVVGTSVGLIAVLLGFGVVGYVFIRVTSYFLSGSIYWFIIRFLLPHFRLQLGIDWNLIKRLRAYIGSGLLLRSLSTIVNGLDRTLIAAWVSLAAVGIYSVPYLVVNSMTYLVPNLVAFTMPMASELQNRNQISELQMVYLSGSRFIAGISSVVYPLLFVLGSNFLLLWVGNEVVSQASNVLLLMVIAAYIGSLSVSLANNVSIGTGRILMFTIYALVRSGTILLGYLLFIRRYGIDGAGYAMLLGSPIEIAFSLYTAKFIIQLSLSRLFREAYLKPVLTGIGLAGLAFLVKPLTETWVGLIGVVSLLVVAYILFGFQIGIFGELEKRALVGLWKAASFRFQKIITKRV